MTVLKIPEHLLREQLLVCTTESPFYSHRGEVYRQVDGISMGSPLGVLFAEAYMAEVERRVMSSNPKPRIYTRFRDDIMIAVDEDEEVDRLARELKANSVLNFTIELSNAGKLPYLDVLIMQQPDQYGTEVYVKPTNVGKCLNAQGECPDAYKRSVIAAYVRRALKYCMTWESIDRELNRVRQLLTNNGYQDNMIEEVIRGRVSKLVTGNQNPEAKPNIITLYYNLAYGSRYKEEAEAVRKIIDRGVQAAEDNTEVSLRVYCRSHLTAALVMRNSTAPRKSQEDETNVVYKFVCPDDACQHRNINYIGLTRKTLKERMKKHRNAGAINEYYTSVHDRRPTVPELLENTTIIHLEPERKRLAVAEAVSIALRRPTLNVQCEFDYVLPSRRRRTDDSSAPAVTAVEDVVIVGEVRRQRAQAAARGGEGRVLRPLPHRI